MVKNSRPKPEVSIVIGAYSEGPRIQANLKRVASWLKKGGYYEKTELVLVTADSPDGTAGIVSKTLPIFANYQQIKPGKKVGKGRDISLGMLAAKGKYIIFMDADLATPLHNLEAMINDLMAGNDVVIGVRDISTMHKSWLRKMASTLSNLIIKIMIWQDIPDTQCGFKGFSKKAAKNIFKQQKINGWGFDFEVLALAKKMGYKVTQINLPDWEDPKPTGEGLVGEGQVAAQINTLKDLFKVRWNLSTNKYDVQNKKK